MSDEPPWLSGFQHTPEQQPQPADETPKEDRFELRELPDEHLRIDVQRDALDDYAWYYAYWRPHGEDSDEVLSILASERGLPLAIADQWQFPVVRPGGEGGLWLGWYHGRWIVATTSDPDLLERDAAGGEEEQSAIQGLVATAIAASEQFEEHLNVEALDRLLESLPDSENKTEALTRRNTLRSIDADLSRVDELLALFQDVRIDILRLDVDDVQVSTDEHGWHLRLEGWPGYETHGTHLDDLVQLAKGMDCCAVAVGMLAPDAVLVFRNEAPGLVRAVSDGGFGDTADPADILDWAAALTELDHNFTMRPFGGDAYVSLSQRLLAVVPDEVKARVTDEGAYGRAFESAARRIADLVYTDPEHYGNLSPTNLPKPPAPAVQQVKARRQAIPQAVKREVWQRDEGRCVDCGTREKLEFDHIIPRSRGGADTVRNLQLLCEPCNRRKGATI